MPKVTLTGSVALELLAPYFRSAGYEVSPPDASPDVFRPDYIYDVTSHDTVLAGEVGGFFDERMRRLSGCPYSLNGIKAIVDEFGWEVMRSRRKVLAVDADNTLWKGILSEDGRDALVPFSEFQDGLKSLAADGVVLVLLSKNDPFVLDWFAKCKVNWEPKPGNLIEACRELNLSTDSVVFVDDSAHERAQMSAHLPEVAVAPFPDDMFHPKQFLRRLREYFFAEVGVTAEDRLRALDYRANALRSQYLGKEEYLDALELRVTPSLAVAGDLDRLAQMAGKTNQFNSTAIRRTRDEFERLICDPARAVFVYRTSDRFGEQGVVCYVIVERGSCRITDFVMSCRAMGRTLEHFVYRHVASELGSTPVLDYEPTAKNAPFAKFIAQLPNLPPTHYRKADVLV